MEQAQCAGSLVLGLSLEELPLSYLLYFALVNDHHLTLLRTLVIPGREREKTLSQIKIPFPTRLIKIIHQ